MCFVQLRDFGITRGEMPARRQQNIVAILTEVLRPDGRIGGANKNVHFGVEIQLLHLLDDGHAVRRRWQREHDFRAGRFGFQDQIGKIL